jgi:hypothetical protein
MRSEWMVVAGSVLLATGWAQNLDPVIADPQHYHLEFQNQWVRIIREKMGPHENAAPTSGAGERGRLSDRSECFRDAGEWLDADSAPTSWFNKSRRKHFNLQIVDDTIR